MHKLGRRERLKRSEEQRARHVLAGTLPRRGRGVGVAGAAGVSAGIRLSTLAGPVPMHASVDTIMSQSGCRLRSALLDMQRARRGEGLAGNSADER